MDQMLTSLRAVAEPTRLRLLALCAEGELTVTELTQILGQSQPRVSRHLKLLVEAGLLERFREGSWAFYRLAREGGAADLARFLLDRLPAGERTLGLDRGRLGQVRQGRAAQAAAYFRDAAPEWDALRSLHVDEGEVEAALLGQLPATVGDHLDVGTGTGRLLVLLKDRARRGIGVDQSREMLAVARANLDRAGATDRTVRQADMYALPFPDGSADLVTLHQVLHYADAPEAVLAECARVLRPAGRLAVVDFAPHAMEELRDRHAHRRLGFAGGEVEAWCRACGLDPRPTRLLPGGRLSVQIWTADRPAAVVALRPRAEAPVPHAL